MITKQLFLPQKHNINHKELILEIELNGKMKFDILLNAIYNEMGVHYKVVNANVEYFNGNDFGSFQLYLNTTKEEFENLEYFLNKNKLLNTNVEYLCKKYF
ncbi:NIL domain-containing protein [Chryseobacterium piscicola]|uniref:Cysteine methyltransferase n=1 Tax=Chryseobacterium piscicola TaxID=551459 RepID=A0A1N7MSB2_9FLAO|nr:NIL domain-containing protein [Chryseobacterium piscicola]PQA93346.1 cysteine methyltransferase [Chryseobacterium piscicola]SIS89025.1 NIL domain-containing protein [Chryseobacterium piscicola]